MTAEERAKRLIDDNAVKCLAYSDLEDLIAAAIREAVEAEREACAKAAEMDLRGVHGGVSPEECRFDNGFGAKAARRIAAAIRARGTSPAEQPPA
jgi:hypothetical protein